MEIKNNTFNLLKYLFLPKGFKITLKLDYIYRETERTISSPCIKSYTNDNGKIKKNR